MEPESYKYFLAFVERPSLYYKVERREGLSTKVSEFLLSEKKLE